MSHNSAPSDFSQTTYKFSIPDSVQIRRDLLINPKISWIAKGLYAVLWQMLDVKRWQTHGEAQSITFIDLKDCADTNIYFQHLQELQCHGYVEIKGAEVFL